MRPVKAHPAPRAPEAGAQDAANRQQAAPLTFTRMPVVHQEDFMNQASRATTIAKEEHQIWELAHQAYSETSSDEDRQTARDQFIHRELLTEAELDVMGLTLAAGLALQRQSSHRSAGLR